MLKAPQAEVSQAQGLEGEKVWLHILSPPFDMLKAPQARGPPGEGWSLPRT